MTQSQALTTWTLTSMVIWAMTRSLVRAEKTHSWEVLATTLSMVVLATTSSTVVLTMTP